MSAKKVAQLQKHLHNLERGKKAMATLIEKEEEAWFLQAYLHSYDKKKGGITGEEFTSSGKTKFIPVRPHLGPKRELEHRFQVIKKQKKDLLRIEKAISTAQELISVLLSLPPQNSPPSAAKSKKTPPPRKPYHRFLSSLGDEIWVGRSSQDNDTMTFQCAKGPDLWLHISGQPGPHLVIPKPPDKEISHKTLLEALQLVLHFSGKLTSGEITVTERKHVHKRKGDPKGTVTLSKMKTYHASKNEPLLAALLQSKFTLLP